jgi:perosamine synthetase
MIPFSRPYFGREELDAIGKVLDTRWVGLGAVTQEFEEQLRSVLGVKHVIAVNTGTSALHVALEALDLHSGDEVIVPSLTFVSPVQAILSAGGTPVFCDVTLDTLNIDPVDVAARITPRTRAIMPAHYAGVPCDMDAILSLASHHHLNVVEDAAHAFGSRYKGRNVGALGDLTCFSFDPIKNITCGEGGAVATEDDELARRIIPRRNVGIESDRWSRRDALRPWDYQVVSHGFRYHMPNLNAAIGLEQLKRLEAFRARKNQIVRRYDEEFGELNGLALLRHDLVDTFPFMYVVRVLGGRRDALMLHLKGLGIGTGVHYIPNHLQPLFQTPRVCLPVTESAFEEILTLPLFFEMTDDQADSVIAGVRAFLRTAPGSRQGESGHIDTAKGTE